MEKGYESVLKVLKEDEYIIYKTDRNFKFGEKNALVKGEKLLLISNFGRIFIADKSRLLKSIKLYTYDHIHIGTKFNVLNKDDMVAINSRDVTDNKKQSFILNMKINDFIDLIKELMFNPFIIEWEKYLIKINDDAYYTVNIDLTRNRIVFSYNQESYSISYLDISNIEINVASILIKSNKNIEIYCINKDVNELYERLEANKNGCGEVDLGQTYIMTSSDIEFLNSKTSGDEKIIEYYNSELIETSNDIIYGNVSGTINGIRYSKKKFEVYVENDLVIKDTDLDRDIYRQKIEEIKGIKEDRKLLIKEDNNLFILEYDNLDKNIKVKSLNELYIGYTEKFQPFECIIDNIDIKFEQKNTMINKISFSNIADISFIQKNDEFSFMCILEKDSTVNKFYVRNFCVEDIFRKIYEVKLKNSIVNRDKNSIDNYLKSICSEYYYVNIFSDIISIKMILGEYLNNNISLDSVYSRLIYEVTKFEITINLFSMNYLDFLEKKSFKDMLTKKEKFAKLNDILITDTIRIKSLLMTVIGITDNNSYIIKSEKVKGSELLEVNELIDIYILEDLNVNDTRRGHAILIEISNLVEQLINIKFKYVYSKIQKIIIQECIKIDKEEIYKQIENYYIYMQLKKEKESDKLIKDKITEFDLLDKKKIENIINILSLS